MSGSATSQWELPTHQIQLIEREARLVNCPTDSVDSMVACMNTVSFFVIICNLLKQLILF